MVNCSRKAKAYEQVMVVSREIDKLLNPAPDTIDVDENDPMGHFYEPEAEYSQKFVVERDHAKEALTERKYKGTKVKRSEIFESDEEQHEDESYDLMGDLLNKKLEETHKYEQKTNKKRTLKDSSNIKKPKVRVEIKKESQNVAAISLQKQFDLNNSLFLFRIACQKMLHCLNNLPTDINLQKELPHTSDLEDISTEVSVNSNLLTKMINVTSTISAMFGKTINVSVSSDSDAILETVSQLNDDLMRSIIHYWDDSLGQKQRKMTKDTGFWKFNTNTLNLIERDMENINDLINKSKKRQRMSETTTPNIHSNEFLLIYDDTDFYCQQLRDVVENERILRVKTETDPWKRTNLEESSKKSLKSVIEKSSKEKLTKYVIHPKIVGFMAPVALPSLSDSTRNNIFDSLPKSSSLISSERTKMANDNQSAGESSHKFSDAECEENEADGFILFNNRY